MARSRVPTASAELAAAELGDERLRHRLMRMSDRCAAAPSSGLPKIAGSDGELEGVYRFLSNERVTPHKILAPHIASTLERIGGQPDVLAVHDTTEFGFGGSSPRGGLGRINEAGEKQGFFGHFALAVSADGERQPLGLLGLRTYVRGRKKTARQRHKRRPGEENERSRWFQLALEVGEMVPQAIHVMDREGDSYEIAAALVNAGARFVIRICRDRRLVPDGGYCKLFAASDAAPVICERNVTLSRRKGRADKRDQKIHPTRDERTARLVIRASTHVIQRPIYAPLANCPPELKLNIVVVEEENPPSGEQPVSWKLLTTERIDSTAAVEAIIDHYRARWIIEEFFKALKTGCAFEKRQLESLRALLNALAIFSVVAWRLLLLRYVARRCPDAPAEHALTAQQVKILQAISKMRESGVPRIDLPSRRPTARDVLYAVAQLGGHLKRNGSPGWLVLGRGYDALLLLELGWSAREKM